MQYRPGGTSHTILFPMTVAPVSGQRWVGTTPWTNSISIHGFVLSSLFLHRKTQFLSQSCLCKWELSVVIPQTSLTDLTVSKNSALREESCSSSNEIATQEDILVLQNDVGPREDSSGHAGPTEPCPTVPCVCPTIKLTEFIPLNRSPDPT